MIASRTSIPPHAQRWMSVLVSIASASALTAAVPFTLQGPGVSPSQFRVTEFASGLNYPVGMAELPDGSILATSSDGPNFFNSNGRLLRFADADQNGIADGPGAVLYTGLTGGITSVRIAGSLVFVTGQNKPIYVLRLGATPASGLTLVGRVDISYPSGGWLHPHSALATRPTPGQPSSYDLFFQIGSKVNFAATTSTASFTTTSLGGLSGTLQGDSIYSITFSDRTNSVAASALTQVANGVRNPSGFAFHPRSGDFYFEDNGIDGLVDANEPFSADELNVLPAAQVGGPVVESYGFPASYVAYRTGLIVGNVGHRPLVAFQPLPDPLTGAESEGPNDIAFAPRSFPEPFENGVFVSFHGKFTGGGSQNEENALVFVDLNTTNYFHVIPPKLPGVGHLDGVLGTARSLFISDISTTGALNNATGKGVIYQIKPLVGPRLRFRQINEHTIELSWQDGVLQSAQGVNGVWTDIVATSPYAVGPTASGNAATFYRTRN